MRYDTYLAEVAFRCWLACDEIPPKRVRSRTLFTFQAKMEKEIVCPRARPQGPWSFGLLRNGFVGGFVRHEPRQSILLQPEAFLSKVGIGIPRHDVG